MRQLPANHCKEKGKRKKNKTFLFLFLTLDPFFIIIIINFIIVINVIIIINRLRKKVKTLNLGYLTFCKRTIFLEGNIKNWI